MYCDCKLQGKDFYRKTCPKCGYKKSGCKGIGREEYIFLKEQNKKKREESKIEYNKLAQKYIEALRGPISWDPPKIPYNFYQWEDSEKLIWRDKVYRYLYALECKMGEEEKDINELSRIGYSFTGKQKKYIKRAIQDRIARYKKINFKFKDKLFEINEGISPPYILKISEEYY
jgi:hypothetical protein